ncbi:MAG: GNAT family N-acetyltransferase [Flavobacteriales bacterium]|nr:GNAT family N-acetyltransferase [Flavobacteriales bacterium]
MEKINWKIATFYELNNDELFDVFALRTAIFVVEQDCPYQEVDETDKIAFHVLGIINKELVAVARIVPPSQPNNEVKIGRIAVKKAFRRQKIAGKMMEECFRFIEQHWKKLPVAISAQQYLIEFYTNYNFKVEGEGYLEDGIPHMRMVRG